MKFAPRRRQHGISLAVSLILLVVITLVALANMRGVVLQNKMSAGTYDRSLSFQAAEAALREAEGRAATVNPASLPASSNCDANGYCGTPPTSATPRWQDAAFSSWRAAAAATLVPAEAPTPEAIVEDMGQSEDPEMIGCSQKTRAVPNCVTQRFQITARAVAAGRAAVQLQSQFAQP